MMMSMTMFLDISNTATATIIVLLCYFCTTRSKTWHSRLQVAWTWLFLDWFCMHPNVLKTCRSSSSSSSSSDSDSNKTRDHALKIDCALLRLCDVLYIVDFIKHCPISILYVEQCHVANAAVLRVFCELLAMSCPSLKQVTFHYLHGSGGGGGCENSIGNILVDNATLEELHLRYCFFDGGGGAFAAAAASASASASAAENLGQGLARNKSVKRIHLVQCGLENNDLESLVATLLRCRESPSQNTAQSSIVNHVNLQCNEISGKHGGRQLGLLIQECFPTSLQELVLADNPLGPLGARALAPSLVTATTNSSHSSIVLVKLDLTGCNLGNQGVENLIPVADGSSSSSITTLLLSNNGIIGAAGGQALGTMLQHGFVNVQTLDLSRNPLGTAGLYQLVVAIQKGQGQGCRAFQHFNLNACSLGNGSTSSSAFMKGGATEHIMPLEVHRVDVTQNCHSATTMATAMTSGQASAAAGEVLVQAILSCFTNVQELELSNNHIGPAAAQKLAMGLEQQQGIQKGHDGCSNRRLRFLGLSFCHLGNDGAKLLANSIGTHDNVEFLAMSGNEITSAAMSAIASMLERCKNMRKLDISDNKLIFNDQPSLSAVAAFARAFQQSSPTTATTTTTTPSSLRELDITCWDERKGHIELEDNVQNILLSGIQNNASLHVVNGEFSNENQLLLDSMLLRNRMITHVVESLNHATLAVSRTTLMDTFLEMSSRHDGKVVGASATFLLLCNHHANIITTSSSIMDDQQQQQRSTIAIGEEE